MGDWKLVKAPGGGTEPGELAGKATTAGAQLYKLKNDIGETHNLAGENPEKLKEMCAVWEKWNAELVEPKWGPARAAASKKAAKRKSVN